MSGSPAGVTPDEDVASGFIRRVAAMFGTKVVTFAVAFFNGILLARLLGPSGKGDYYLLLLLPTTFMVFVQLGLPQAFGYFAARGQTRGIVRMTLAATAALSVAAFGATVLLMPILQADILHDLEPFLILLGFLSLPLALNATFTSGILLARKWTRWYSAVSIVQVLAAAALLAVLVGVLGLGVRGAIAAYLIYQSVQAAGFLIGAARASAANPSPARLRARDVLRYALPLYPASTTEFFTYRADVFLIAALIADPSAPLGYYSMAVTIAELVFFVPTSVSLVLFPHVAGSAREDSARQIPIVCRVTLLASAGLGIALVPAAIVLILVVLPAFAPSLPALFVLLPGVVALSVSRVLTDYLAGLGRTATTSAVTVGAFVLNVAANLVLIPRYGIVGASAASLISYSASSIAFTFVAARLAGTSPFSLWIPRRSDVVLTAGTAIALGRGFVRRRRPESPQPGATGG